MNKKEDKMLFTAKRGISEIVSYTLMVVIAVGISVLVYSYLQLQAPKDKAQCPDDISLQIQQLSCKYSASGSNLTVVLKNSGLFTVDAAYLRFGKADKKIRELINDPGKGSARASFFLDEPNTKGLAPGKSITRTYSLSTGLVPLSGNYVLESQPAVFVKNALALCERAVTTQAVTCSG